MPFRPACNYAKLDDPAPLFQVSLEKQCRMFPYLWTPECAQAVAQGEYTPCACRSRGPEGTPQGAYRGCPTVRFEYDAPGTAAGCAAPPSGV